MSKNLLIAVLFFAEIFLAYAQPEKDKPRSEPVDLPEIIITEEAKLFTATGVKQFPAGPSLLNSLELDSLNSLEKQQALLLPGEPLPDKALHKDFSDGFLKGSFGRFATPALEAGYAFKLGDYKLYSEGGFEFSNGHTDNANYSKINLMLISDYIAPDKFWLFGGSNTRTNISLNNHGYNLYARENNINRNVFNLNARVDVNGSYEGYIYNTGAGFRTIKMTGNSGSLSYNEISGYLAIKTYLKGFAFGGDLNLELHSLHNTGLHFAQLNAFGSYTFSNVTITAKGGFQSASGSSEIGRGGFILEGNINYIFNRLFTFSGNISTGLENNNFIEKVNYNPYISDSVAIDFPYNISSLRFNVAFHPTQEFNLSGSVTSRLVSRYGAFTRADKGLFKLDYINAKLIEVNVDAALNISAIDKFIAGFRYNILRSTDNSKSVPYIPLFLFSLSYHRYWHKNFGTEIGINYTGRRFSDIDNKLEVLDYNNLWLRANYKISNLLTIFTYFENLANSDVYIWEGYKERNLFLSLGLLWQF